MTIEVNKILRFNLTATDVDNTLAELTFGTDSVTIPEVMIQLVPGTGEVSFSSMVEGLFTIKFEVCDNLDSCASTTVNITVVGVNNNLPPYFTTNPTMTIYLGASYLYKVEAMDPEGDAVSYALMEGPSGMVLDSQDLTWTPGPTQMGEHRVNITATDGKHPPVSQEFTIQVLRTNRPPEAEIQDPDDGDIFDEGATIPFSGWAFDPDFNVLSYTWRINGVVVSNDLGFNRSLTPGTYTVSFAVSDGTVTVYDNISIGVRFVETPPDPYQTSTSGEEYCLWLPLVLIITIVAVVVTLNHFSKARRRPQM
jgi:hypothetical protein